MCEDVVLFGHGHSRAVCLRLHARSQSNREHRSRAMVEYSRFHQAGPADTATRKPLWRRVA